ncbi:MAG: PglZ domain-containing protein [Pirellulales bacterium]|nr:PglZ domain-containing protein [Pirellulales bacterium]
MVAAKAIEEEANIAGLDLAARTITGVETFASIEMRLLRHAEVQLLAGAAADGLNLARRRKQSFWAMVELTHQLHWSLLETTAQLLLTAARIETELKTTKKEPAALVKAYAEGDAVPSGEPWCLLDTYHRRLERQYATFDLDVGGKHGQLEQVITAARHRYTAVAGQCAEAMTDALEASRFELEDLIHQSEIFSSQVGPQCRQGQTAYLLVDALRYEMARELIEGLGDGFKVQLVPVVAQLPTITDVGMSAIMPHAEKGMELVPAGSGKVAIQIAGVTLKDRAKRIAQLRSAIPGGMIDSKLNNLMKPSKKQREEIEGADFTLVTSQEIDRRGEETEDEEEARRYMDEVLDKLRRGVRTLGKLGMENVIIVADHGHLFGEVLDSGMKIDPPGGDTVDLHRRVWIGRGGAVGDAFVRVTVSQLGLGGDLELAFPRGLGCFKTPGGTTAFFHG